MTSRHMATTSHRLSPVHWALTLLLVCLYLPGIFLRDFWIYDEGRRAIIALEMIQRGDWIVPRLMGSVILTKPPLFYWLEALAYSLFGGPSDWAARIPSVVAGVCGIFALHQLLRRLLDPSAALLGGLILAVLPVYNWMAQNAEPEMLFVTFGTLALLCFVGASLDDSSVTLPLRRRAWLGWLCLGMSFMSKGPVVPLCILLTVGLWRRLAAPRQRLGPMEWPIGIVIMLLPALAWALMLWHHGYPPMAFYRELTHHVGDEAPHREAFSYYFAELDTMALPYWFVLLAALAVGLMQIVRQGMRFGLAAAWGGLHDYLARGRAERLLIVLWLLVTFLVMSIIPSKRYYYGLVLLPSLAAALAMVVRDWATRPAGPAWRWLEVNRAWMATLLALIAAIMLFAAFVTPRPELWESYIGKEKPDAPMFMLMIALLFAAGAIGFLFFGPHPTKERIIRSGFLASTLAMGLVAACYNFVIHPRLNASHSYRLAAEQVLGHLPPGRQLFSVGSNETLWFYLQRPDMPVLHDNDQLEANLAAHRSDIGVVFEERLDEVTRHARIRELYRSNFIAQKDARVIVFEIEQLTPQSD